MEAPGEVIAPRSELESRLCEIFAEALGLEAVSVRDDFFALGGHSLLAVKVVADIQSRLGRRAPLVTLFQCTTAERLAQVLDDGQAVNGGPSSFAAIRARGTMAPLFIGGSHPRYVELVSRLDSKQPVYRLDVYALLLSRMEQGLPVYRCVEDIAARFIEDVRTVQPTGPYYLGGGCEGAMVAFEMARVLQAQGEDIASLVMWTTPTWLGGFGGAWRRFPMVRLMRHVRSVLARGSARRMTPKQWRLLVRHEYVEYRVFKAIEDYQPSTAFQGRVALIWPAATGSWIEPLSEYWRRFATDGADVFVVPGDHDTWLDEHAHELGDVVARCLTHRGRTNSGS